MKEKTTFKCGIVIFERYDKTQGFTVYEYRKPKLIEIQEIILNYIIQGKVIKMKIVSLSFDDGTIYDLKFIELLNKYKLNATLNLNSGLCDFIWTYCINNLFSRSSIKPFIFNKPISYP